jgi:hypothetical protein
VEAKGEWRAGGDQRTGGVDGVVVGLRQEVLSLRAALRARPVIARALGVIQERYGLPDFDIASGMLRESARRHDLRDETVARALLAAPVPQAEVWFPGRIRRPAPSLSFCLQDREHRRDRTAVLSLFLDAVVEYMRTPMADVQVVTVAGGRPRLELYRDVPPDLVDHVADLDDPEAAAVQAVTRGVRYLHHVPVDSGRVDDVVLKKAGVRTVHSVPLLDVDGECAGVVSTYHSELGFRPSMLQCAKLDHAAAEVATWLTWHRRTVVMDALEHLHTNASGRVGSR